MAEWWAVAPKVTPAPAGAGEQWWAAAPVVAPAPAPAPEAAPAAGLTSGLGTIAQVLQDGISIPQALGGALEEYGKIGANIGKYFGPVADPSQIANRLAVLFPGYNAKSPSATVGRGGVDVGVGIAVPNMLGGMVKGVPALAPVGEAIQSFGGAKGVGKLTNIAGGAIAGGLGAGAVDTSNAAAGAAIGAAIPLLGAAISNPTIRRWADNILPGGSDRQIMRVVSEAFGNDPTRIKQALDLATQGRSIEQIAVMMNEPTLAAVAEGAPYANEATKKLFADRQLAQRTGQANQLAKAAGYVEPSAANANALVERTGTLLPERDVADLGAQVRGAGLGEARGVKAAVIDPAYAKARELAGPTPNVNASGILDKAREIYGDTLFSPGSQPSEVGVILRRLTNEEGAAPVMTLNDVIALDNALGSEIAAAKAAPGGDRSAVRLLTQLKDSVKQAVNDSPDLAPEAKAAWQEAKSLFKSEYAPRFTTGKQSSVLWQSKTGQPAVLDEKVIDAFMTAGGKTEAQNLVKMIGDNPEGRQAVADAVREKFRAAVTKDGAIDPKAVRTFLERHKMGLGVLDDAGVLPTAELKGVEATVSKLTADAEALAGKSKVIEGLRAKVAATPTDTEAAKSLAEAEQAIADVMDALKTDKGFKELAALGSRNMEVGIDTPSKLKVPVGIQTEILYNNIDAFLSKRMGRKAADKLARELMNIPEFTVRLGKVLASASKGAGTPINALAPAVVPGFNALKNGD